MKHENTEINKLASNNFLPNQLTLWVLREKHGGDIASTQTLSIVGLGFDQGREVGGQLRPDIAAMKVALPGSSMQCNSRIFDALSADTVMSQRQAAAMFQTHLGPDGGSFQIRT
ncbi:hypothetical protein MCOR27_010928 [Pyricularia oryzae]|uniref:Uncharacterized protein n=1 Tax=Pyricularia grisea TaxID=148305 RepID=A0ABQ8N5P9_PYRGI|nr:hypothetical protein MCOR01_011134 [Pyricularia oryzae]KAI6291395.1 hypothetical protein MCOR33_010644 [Pyricularia grisea]KAI6253193.1 hypothetical protein MCOR19_010248 [Pyricularia oryzae]KAI6266662.1 hypothetical protein MCOR27_010928 [Pyricularia oryzae]KAI6278097.1 hypothetical protein MCOR26_004813 [Pyricularia oryzae]